METLQQLLDLYRDDARIQALRQALEAVADGPPRLRVAGLQGAQEAFAIAGLYLNEPRHTLVVANDKEEAAYLQNSLANLFGKKEVRFLPDSFKRPMHFEELDNNNVLQRTEIINKVSASRAAGELIVTYPEALFEQVVAPMALEKTRIVVKKDEAIDVPFIVEVLVEYGFERVDFVYEPGQFSVRGGIVDIFSFGNEWPYRIELFDKDVESIRLFNPGTQLSLRKVSEISIVPNINTRFRNDEKVSVFRVLMQKTVLWIKDVQLLLDRLQVCFEKAVQLAEKIQTMEDKVQEAELLKERAFMLPHAIMADLAAFPIVFYGGPVLQALPIDGPPIVFRSQPQPNFNKNFGMLIENLHANSASGHTNYIFTDNPKQIERFYSIFEDLKAQVAFQPVPIALHEGFVDSDLGIACYTDHQIFQRFHRYRIKQGFSKDQSLNLRLLRELQPGDFVTHIDHGVGRYSGLEKLTINGHTQESVRLIYQNNDVLYVSINALHKISKFVGKEGTEPKLSKLGSDAWQNLKRRTKAKMKDIAGELIKLYAQRKASPGHAFPPDGYLQNELEASFIYEDTPDQLKSTNDVKQDMERPYPMDRLICGDVGFGKTEVAIRAAFKAVTDGKQVAILVPTTILALQHFKTFGERLADFGATVEYVNRFRQAKDKREVFKRTKAGEVDILIGTHAILNKDLSFKDLGLLIVDEEQKFGVGAKEKLRQMSVGVDTLTLTATPIPRTLQFSLMAARDLSVIRTPPPNRQPIHTEIRIFSDELVKESIYYETMRGGQVFFVHNRVKSLPDILAMVQRLCPDVDVAMAHGQMEPKRLEDTLVRFIDGEFDVLVCTNIIETGLDIPNANTIIINNAHQFGLSDLHQLRGRVGRSNRKAFCYLFCPPLSVLTPEARKRLKTLEEFSELGSGFDIAMRDLDIRGAGNLLGAEQSGFIADIGYETYQKILDEAMQELKETDFRELFAEELQRQKDFVREVIIETDEDMHIPDEYVASTQERLSLYTELDKLETEAELLQFGEQLRDRFGKLPRAVDTLFEGLRLRWLCRALGFERLVLKNRKLLCYFISNPQSPFYDSPQFAALLQSAEQLRDRRLSFKRSTKHFIMVREDIRDFAQARNLLAQIQAKMAEHDMAG